MKPWQVVALVVFCFGAAALGTHLVLVQNAATQAKAKKNAEMEKLMRDLRNQAERYESNGVLP